MPSLQVLQLSSGVGPVEVRRFLAALATHLEALAVSRGLEVVDVACHGEPLRPRSVSLTLRGDAAGRLADQLGTHELVHRFGERGKAARKRWFAAVSLHAHGALAPGARHPGGGGPPRLTPPPREELEITACRAGGPGGQHVNKVATAVRVRHLPSGLSVRSAAARSQKANLDHALMRLAGLLADAAAAAAQRAVRARRHAHYQVVRGLPVASYALQPDGALTVVPA